MTRHIKHPIMILVHPERIQIIRYMMGKNYLTSKEISEGTNLHEQTVNTHLKALQRFGLIECSIRYEAKPKPLYEYKLNYDPLIQIFREKILEYSNLLNDLEYYAKREKYLRVATATLKPNL